MRLQDIPLGILFEALEDLDEKSLSAQYKDNYPDLYAKHKQALAQRERDPKNLGAVRSNLAFKMMTRHSVQPTQVSKMISARKKRETRTNMPPIVMKSKVDDTKTVPMTRKLA